MLDLLSIPFFYNRYLKSIFTVYIIAFIQINMIKQAINNIHGKSKRMVSFDVIGMLVLLGFFYIGLLLSLFVVSGGSLSIAFSDLLMLLIVAVFTVFIALILMSITGYKLVLKKGSMGMM